MKIISVNNPQSQNRPLAFGVSLYTVVSCPKSGFVNLMAAESKKPNSFSAAIVLQFTTTAFAEFKNFLGEFAKKFPPKDKVKIPQDVLQIGIKSDTGNPRSPFSLWVNHHNVFSPDGKVSKEFAPFLETLKHILEVASGRRNTLPAQTMTAKRQMRNVLLGDSNFAFAESEYAFGIGEIQKIASRLLGNISERMRAVSTES